MKTSKMCKLLLILPTTWIQEKLAHIKTSRAYETILALKSQFGSFEDVGGVTTWVY